MPLRGLQPTSSTEVGALQNTGTIETLEAKRRRVMGWRGLSDLCCVALRGTTIDILLRLMGTAGGARLKKSQTSWKFLFSGLQCWLLLVGNKGICMNVCYML